MSNEDPNEQAWQAGHAAAWREVLGAAIHNLAGWGDTAELQAARYLAERQDIIAVLRRVCAEHGDNDWPDDLHLGDVIEKHLERHLP